MDGEKPNTMIFRDINGELEEGPTEIESMCPSCHENGLTKLLLTRIPHYGDVVIVSFSCDSCGESNNEIRPGGKFAEDVGISFHLKVSSVSDISRTVIKSDWASVQIPSIELEIPSQSQKGEITTIEGILNRTEEGLISEQPAREIMDPDGAKQIKDFVDKIHNLLKVAEPWEIIIRDISGQSFIENKNAPQTDPLLSKVHFKRSKSEDEKLGIFPLQDEETTDPDEDLKNEVLCFPSNCPNCNSPAETNMKMTDIPHFKEVVIMAMVCDYCGHKTNEVKSGGGIEAKATKITLNVKESYDNCRDILKSETCSISIPELEFEMTGYSLGGKFTTLEGLLNNIKDQIENNPLSSGVLHGDSSQEDTQKKLSKFKERLDDFIVGNTPYTFIMDDPAGNSYIQNLYAPEDDPQLHIVHYERTNDQNEDLGLNDMKVENYEEHPTATSVTTKLLSLNEDEEPNEIVAKQQ
ncbi:zinc finger protein ZPR1 [Lepeophtheirus salmonis]|uniref:zinc finger protein ZPR1 n=1 Tax=Lepeophtheirus salmonis TaxID=72036 RepID=UPI001AE1B4C1|nr:zinc finger protein ZPR1-like [Lepeophtheirus salmonis]